MEWEEFTQQGFDFSHGFTPTVTLKEDRPHYPDLGGHVLAAHVTGDKLNVVYVADIDMISDWFFLERSRGESNLNFDNVTFVLNHPELPTFNPLSFYILRSGQVRRGQLSATP